MFRFSIFCIYVQKNKNNYKKKKNIKKTKKILYVLNYIIKTKYKKIKLNSKNWNVKNKKKINVDLNANCKKKIVLILYCGDTMSLRMGSRSCDLAEKRM